MKKTALPMVFSYVSVEEKKAFDALAKLESRGISSLLRTEMVKVLKARGLFREEMNENGEIVQTAMIGSKVEGEPEKQCNE